MSFGFQRHRRGLFVLAIALCMIPTGYYLVDAQHHGIVHKGLLPASRDLYPMWEACRAVRNHIDPYSDEVTRETQIQVYGAPVGVNRRDPMRFVYPLPAVLMFGPIAWLSYRTACNWVLLLSVTFTTLSVLWLSSPGRKVWLRVAAVSLNLCSFPVILSLLLVQPTLVYAGVLAASLACFRRGRNVAGGMLLALATGKPQLALLVFIPVAVFIASSWRKRQAAAMSFAAVEIVSLGGSFLVQPNWLVGWLRAIREYPGYTRPSLFLMLFGEWAGGVVCILAVAFVIYVSLRYARTELMLAISCSITLLLLVIPYQPYNDVLLLAPAFYVAEEMQKVNQAVKGVCKVGIALFLVASCGVIPFVVTAGVLYPAHGWDLGRPALTLACFVRPAAILVALVGMIARPNRSTQTMPCAAVGV